ncbi:hypothetical protein RHSIM_Rhsim08G0000300 [Rhododendron simsii]|uniref:Deacetylase sirtuin-type domain-containing protein n=1 Tax=Rhododendron simsii TaxID=118357 RepID=A0A834GMQ8_RHOSS|nr:hypothetical protein RHSIM_Rhsim08G0000300 [Rhododendron simsii]
MRRSSTTCQSSVNFDRLPALNWRASVKPPIKLVFFSMQKPWLGAYNTWEPSNPSKKQSRPGNISYTHPITFSLSSNGRFTKKRVALIKLPSPFSLSSVYHLFLDLKLASPDDAKPNIGLPHFISQRVENKKLFFAHPYILCLCMLTVLFYCSPNGAYSSGFKPITHQEFLRSSRARRRYWARSYAGWRRFTASRPGAAHFALASLEKASRIGFMITQNVDRLHQQAGSNPLELHGTVYTVVCLDCSFSFSRHLFQEQVKALNPKWAAAIESLDYDSRSDKKFGMKRRPDGDVEIDEKFWEEDFHIPTCQKCNGVVKPDVVFFGDNVPKDRADKAMEAAKGCDAFLVLGSSLMTMSAFRLVRAAHEAGAATAIVNVGMTRADDFVPLKITARLGEILPRLLNAGSFSIPAL